MYGHNLENSSRFLASFEPAFVFALFAMGPHPGSSGPSRFFSKAIAFDVKG